ncbi:MAG: protein kinase [Chlorobi bacterium]|nr:protein kinase [Chlorobiota bacterium]
MENLLNKVIQNYKFLSIIGKGGMGIVYKAHDISLDRFVAIKILKPKILEKPKNVERFLREAKNQARLTHSNIVTVYGFIEQDGILGIVMEYVEGDSLDKILHKYGRLHVTDSVFIMRQILSAIGYAHAKGYVHRDIKPSNIIVTKEGVAKIMDFGISKSLFDKTVTKTGSKIGTLLYMSPEQIRGEEVNHLSDIYSLGVTMYEAITGDPPFLSDVEYDVMEGHLHKRPGKVTSIVSGLPEEIDFILFKALEKDPVARYQTCEDFIGDLNIYEKKLAEHKSELFPKQYSNPKRRKALSIAGFGIFLAIISAVVYFSFKTADTLIQSNQLDMLKKYSVKTLFKEDDGGIKFQNMQLIPMPAGGNIVSISMLDDNIGFLIESGGKVFATNDSGNTWNKIFEDSVSFNDADFSKNGRATLIGNESLLIIADNNFENVDRKTLYDKFNLFRVRYLNPQIAFILGSKGCILKSEDAGSSWTIVSHKITAPLYDAYFFDNSNGIIVGWKGTILNTTDGGNIWIAKEAQTEKYLKSIDFGDEENGIIVGGGGTILRTKNGGKSWYDLTIKDAGGLQKVKFIGKDFVIAVGTRGSVIVSNDGGASWRAMKTNLFVKLNDVAVTPDKKIFIVGNNGTILKLW